jgi:heme exporter protein D
MNWGSPGEFFAMGGYGLYIWGSYAVALISMITEVILLSVRRRSLLDRLRTPRPSQRGDR